MATVKYTGPIASFHCPTDAEIRHLKVHFSPKQEGTGDPSPENVRSIVGWEGVEVTHTGKNLFDINNVVNITNDAWCSSSEYIIKPSNGDKTLYIPCLPNTTYTISKTIGDVLAGGYTISTPESGINLYSYHRDTNARNITISTGSDAKYIAIWYYDKSKATDKNITPEDVIKTLQIEYNSTPTSYESCFKENISYQFGTLGKNKFPTADGTRSEIFMKKGVTYTLSATSESLGYFKGFYEDGTDTGVIWLNDGKNNNRYWKSYRPQENIVKGLFFLSGGISECQLELGSTATVYEPYNPNKTVYGGWVDLITGEVCEEYGTMHLDETNNWTGYAKNGVKTRVYLDSGANVIASATYATVPSVSNKFVSQGQNGYPDENKFCFSSTTEGRIFLGLSSSITSLEDFKIWFGDLGGADFAYELITPITYQLHPTELSTFLGQNNVWSNADYVEVEYDLHETQTILQRKQYILANQPHLVTVQDKLVNFHTDLAAPLKSCRVNFEPKQDLHGYDSVWIGGNGKNLFNVNAEFANPSDTTLANTTARIFTPETYCLGISHTNYFIPGNVTTCTVIDNALTINTRQGYGIGFPLKLTAGSTYYMSATIGNGEVGRIGAAFYDISGNYLSGISIVSGNYGIRNSSFTIPVDVDTTVIIFASENADTTFTNIQLELGSTATSYAPYENICPIEGWNNLRITHNSDIVFKPIEETRTETYRNVSVENIPNGIRVINTNDSSYNCAVWYAPCSNYVNKQLKISLTCDFTGGGAGRLYVTANTHDGSTLQSLVQSTIINGQPFREWTITPPDGTEYLRIGLFASDVKTMGYGKYTDYINMYITPIENVPQIIPIKFPTLGKNKFNPNIEWTVGIPYRYAYLPVLEQDCVMSFTLKDSTIDISDISIGFAYSKPTSSAEANKGYRWCMSNGVIKTYEKINRVKETNDASNIDKLCTYIMIISNTDDAYSRLLAAYDIQIEYGSTPTTYEPYNDTIYGGHVDLVSGELTVTHVKDIWDEKSTIELSSNGTYCTRFQLRYGTICDQPSVNTTAGASDEGFFSNYALYKSIGSSDSTWDIENNIAWSIANNGTYHRIFVCPNAVATTVEGLKALLEVTPIEIVAKLSTPITYQLTSQQLKSLKGVNNIWSDANGNVEISYWTH